MTLWWKSAVVMLLMTGVCGAIAVGCGTQPNSATNTVPSNAQKVNVVARNFTFTMDKTPLHAGTPIDFVVTSAESVHGFSIVGTNVHQTLSQGAAPADVVWTPPSAGDYTIRCDEFCGSGHSNMFMSFRVGN